MHHFVYKDGILHAEDVNLQVLAEEIDTPFYCYSTATLERHYKVFDEAFSGTEHQIFYAMKANSNQAVIKTLVDLGAGVDVGLGRQSCAARLRLACRAARSCSPASARRRVRCPTA